MNQDDSKAWPSTPRDNLKDPLPLHLHEQRQRAAEGERGGHGGLLKYGMCTVLEIKLKVEQR